MGKVDFSWANQELSHGGSTLYIETLKQRTSKRDKEDAGSIEFTGNLGDVMKESIRIAYTHAKVFLEIHLLWVEFECIIVLKIAPISSINSKMYVDAEAETNSLNLLLVRRRSSLAVICYSIYWKYAGGGGRTLN